MPYYPQQPEKQPAEPSVRRKKILRAAILCVSLLLIGYGAARLIIYFGETHSSREATREARAALDSIETEVPAGDPETPLPTEKPTPAPTSAPPADEPAEPQATPDTLPDVDYPNGYGLGSRIRKLREKNGYGNVVGWITMDDLDEPVVQKDNTYYLDHSFNGKKNNNGAIFMDQDIRLWTRPYTILLYGHNMKTGDMFGNMRKYEDFSYCYKHRIFRFDTLYEEGQYVIIAVETISLTPGKARYLNLAELQSSRREIRRKALKALMDHSLFSMTTDISEEDQILLLITCVGDDDERLIVAARRLREGETAENLAIRQD